MEETKEYGYFKVVFKKTLALYGDVSFINNHIVELKLNNGQRLLINSKDVLYAEEAERIIME